MYSVATSSPRIDPPNFPCIQPSSGNPHSETYPTAGIELVASSLLALMRPGEKARLLFITWLTNNTFSKRTQFLHLYSIFTIPKKYLLPAKLKVSYTTGKLSISVFHWIFSNQLHSYWIHCKRLGTMSRFHELLPC